MKTWIDLLGTPIVAGGLLFGQCSKHAMLDEDLSWKSEKWLC